MATFDDLEREFRKLRQKVRRLEGVAVPSQDTVSAIVSPSEDDKYDANADHGGGWAAAVSQSHANLRAKLEQEAVRDIRDGQTERESSRKAFYKKYVTDLGRSRVDALILEYRR